MDSFYFHGLPGGPGELALFGAERASLAGSMRIVPRDSIAASAHGGDPFSAMARWIEDAASDNPVELVGFSLGGAAALRVAARLGDRVSRIDLISAAAPLDLGNYLGDMAGRAVFQAALHSPERLARLTKWQSLAARLAPQALVRALLASAKGSDRDLRRDPQFRARLVAIVRSSLAPPAAAYREEIALYVEPWQHELPRVTARVNLYHGTHDNWSPPRMALDLARTLPNSGEVRWLDGFSHYSTLEAWLDRHRRTVAPHPSSTSHHPESSQ